MSVVSVRTHTYITFANPHLVCQHCRQPVARMHDGDACGCLVGSWNMPCQHTAGTISRCPTWSPVDGCTCEDKENHR